MTYDLSDSRPFYDAKAVAMRHCWCWHNIYIYIQRYTVSYTVHDTNRKCVRMRATVVCVGRHIGLNRVNRLSPDAVYYHKFLINYQRKTSDTEQKCRASAKLEETAFMHEHWTMSSGRNWKAKKKKWEKRLIRWKVFFSFYFVASFFIWWRFLNETFAWDCLGVLCAGWLTHSDDKSFLNFFRRHRETSAEMIIFVHCFQLLSASRSHFCHRSLFGFSSSYIWKYDY